jgi:hypothetical protein
VKKKLIALALTSAAFALVRFTIPSHAPSPAGSYEAFAHIYVGGLLGAWLATRERAYLAFVLALTAIETVAFFTK